MMSAIGRTSRICLRCQEAPIESKRGDYCPECLRLLQRPRVGSGKALTWESVLYRVVDGKRLQYQGGL